MTTKTPKPKSRGKSWAETIQEDLPTALETRRKKGSPELAKALGTLAAQTPTYTHEQLQLFRTAEQAGINVGKADGSPYPSVEQLSKFKELVIERHEASKPKILSPFVSREELIAAIGQATIEKAICEPSEDYYRRSGDWSHGHIRYVDAIQLVEILTNGPGN